MSACEAAGIEAEKCDCAGQRARTAIGAELAAKMKTAPADDDPKLAAYYTPAELQRVMAWVETAERECGIAEED